MAEAINPARLAFIEQSQSASSTAQFDGRSQKYNGRQEDGGRGGRGRFQGRGAAPTREYTGGRHAQPKRAPKMTGTNAILPGVKMRVFGGSAAPSTVEAPVPTSAPKPNKKRTFDDADGEQAVDAKKARTDTDEGLGFVIDTVGAAPSPEEEKKRKDKKQIQKDIKENKESKKDREKRERKEARKAAKLERLAKREAASNETNTVTPDSADKPDSDEILANDDYIGLGEIEKETKPKKVKKEKLKKWHPDPDLTPEQNLEAEREHNRARSAAMLGEKTAKQEALIKRRKEMYPIMKARKEDKLAVRQERKAIKKAAKAEREESKAGRPKAEKATEEPTPVEPAIPLTPEQEAAAAELVATRKAEREVRREAKFQTKIAAMTPEKREKEIARKERKDLKKAEEAVEAEKVAASEPVKTPAEKEAIKAAKKAAEKEVIIQKIEEADAAAAKRADTVGEIEAKQARGERITRHEILKLQRRKKKDDKAAAKRARKEKPKPKKDKTKYIPKATVREAAAAVAVAAKSGEQWNPEALAGDDKRKAKFLRLLGAKNEGVAADSTIIPAIGKKSFMDIKKVENELEQQFDAGVKMKHGGAGKRSGLGA